MNAKQPDVVKLRIGAISILLAVYVLQVFTPLRLHHDTVVLLSIAESAERGTGFLYHGQSTVFPPGYPMLIAVLLRLHLARVWIVVGINIIFLVMGLVAVRSLLCKAFCVEKSWALTICALSSLSFVVIKYSTIPMTDICFFGVAMCCLAVMNSLVLRLTVRGLILSLLLLVISICLRRVGLALIPAFLWAIIFQPRTRRVMTRLSVRMKIASVLIAASAFGIVAWLVRTTSTLWDFKLALSGHGLIDSVSGLLAFRLKELGEIAINLPASAFSPANQILLPLVGTLAGASVLAGLVSRRKLFSIVDVFFISYVMVILVWPFYDPRFWLPVIPLLIGYSGLSLKHLVRLRFSWYLVGTYALWFVMTGSLVLISSLAVSFSGPGIGDAYPEQEFHATYCAAGYCKGGLDAAGTVDADALRHLRTFR